jgi:hypothetical protein
MQAGMTLTSKLAVFAVLLPLGACAQEEGGDDARLARYRRALPTRAQLEAPTVQASSSAAVGDPALYPYQSWPIVEGINGAVGWLVDGLELITSFPPTLYNSDTLEYVWGPWEADDGVGWVAAYIRDTEGSADFRYEFALLRGASNDLATLTPVLWGGATPDEADDDHGVGVALWDFEADRAFREANDPAFDPAAGDRGRFAVLFGRGPDENDAANELAFAVAVFRDFVPADQPSNPPADLDYFYGRWTTPTNTVDFLDFETQVDVTEPADGTPEDIGVRMAFLDEGIGRAEADAAGGSMTPTQSATAVECWDTSINRTYLTFALDDAGENVFSVDEGELAGCGMFAATLDELEVPSLQAIDPALMDALDQVASTGLPPAN